MNEFKVIEIKQSIYKSNEEEAEKLRKKLKENNKFLLNLMSSPGSGKTTTLLRTIEKLKDSMRIGIMEADIDSDVDAKTIAYTGVKTIQLHTGGMCHLDAKMTSDGIDNLGIDDLDFIVLENVGNLVCPAEFDTGATKSAMILSVPEGDDKPLKYPLMFKVVDVLLINKIDTLESFDFDIDTVCKRVRKLNPNIKIFPISARKGVGIEDWTNWLKKEMEEVKNNITK